MHIPSHYPSAQSDGLGIFPIAAAIPLVTSIFGMFGKKKKKKQAPQPSYDPSAERARMWMEMQSQRALSQPQSSGQPIIIIPPSAASQPQPAVMQYRDQMPLVLLGGMGILAMVMIAGKR